MRRWIIWIILLPSGLPCSHQKLASFTTHLLQWCSIRSRSIAQLSRCVSCWLSTTASSSVSTLKETLATLGKRLRWHAYSLDRDLPTLSTAVVNYAYFTSISVLGFLLLKVVKAKNPPVGRPRDIDLFFTSVSAVTVSSMSTVEMEVFSNSQLLVLTILMLIGGEVFTSLIGLHYRRLKTSHIQDVSDIVSIEVGAIKSDCQSSCSNQLKNKAIRSLASTIALYMLLVHAVGFISVLAYINISSTARDVLKGKGIHLPTFSIFTTISSFSNCGFIPTNENMMAFRKNSGLLLLIAPQILAGSTMFPVCLRLLLWALGRMSKRPEFDYLLNNSGEIGFYHLFSHLDSLLLLASVLAFISIQFLVICIIEWGSLAFSGLNPFQKLVGVLFLSVSSRHAGETVANLSLLSSAVLVLLVIMMYLPPYTWFAPFEAKGHDAQDQAKETNETCLLKSFNFSEIFYLAVFVMVICITERKKISEDPLNFSVFNIVIEVVSAYRNVGFSVGYNCNQLLKPDQSCTDAWYGMVGKWSDPGKVVLIFVMMFGRLRRYHMTGGKAWNLK